VNRSSFSAPEGFPSPFSGRASTNGCVVRFSRSSIFGNSGRRWNRLKALFNDRVGLIAFIFIPYGYTTDHVGSVGPDSTRSSCNGLLADPMPTSESQNSGRNCFALRSLCSKTDQQPRSFCALSTWTRSLFLFLCGGPRRLLRHPGPHLACATISIGIIRNGRNFKRHGRNMINRSPENCSCCRSDYGDSP
jgi:hypothetical protein